VRRLVLVVLLLLLGAAAPACGLVDAIANSWVRPTTCGAGGGDGAGGAGGGDEGAGGDGSGVGVAAGAGVGGSGSGSAGAGGGDGNARRPPRPGHHRPVSHLDPGSFPAGDSFGFCTGLCTAQCPAVAQGITSGFSSSVFKFVTIVKDDGEGEGGGWQQAIGTLSFFRWTTLVPESWTCTVTVGMPLRAQLYGVITAKQAGIITAGIATTSAFVVSNQQPNLASGYAFCTAFKAEMGSEFAEQYPRLGAKVNKN
jgi:hypothetical protein